MFPIACSQSDARNNKPAAGGGKSAAREAAPVVVASAVLRRFPVRQTAIGTVEACATIVVKARVGGNLDRVHFTEGKEVRKGDVLFTIDPRPFEVMLKQAQSDLDKSQSQLKVAEANLAKDISQARNAQADLERYAAVVNKGAIAREAYDRVRTAAEVASQSVNADKAAVEDARQSIHKAQTSIENAKLNLNYCTIRSPISGLPGTLNVDQGNLIKENDTALVTINQLTPIYVNFAIPEVYLADLKRYMAGGTLKVQVTVPHDEKGPIVGELTFLNNQVDRATGTIGLRATFANEDHRLWPGQFVDVTLTMTERPNAIVVPSQAVQNSQQGTFVFVVTPENTAAMRLVTAGDTLDGLTVIEKGLQPGEKVVIDGQLRVMPGAPVVVKDKGEGATQK